MVLDDILFNESLTGMLTKTLSDRQIVDISLGEITVVAWDVRGNLGCPDAIKE